MTSTPIPVTAAHPLDLAVAWLSKRSKLFSQGWGDEALFARLCDSLSYSVPPSPITMEWRATRERRGITRRDGTFPSPLDLLPDHTKTVHVRAWSRAGNRVACVIPAASRDEGFRAREHIFGGLIARGLDLYFLENPFYGSRRVVQGPSLISVSDHGLMAAGMVLEARALLEHMRPSYPKLVVAGYSMGGHMAAITAAVTPFPVGCAALATGASASSIYTRGLLSWSVDLEALGGGPELRTAARERLHQLFEVADVTRYPLPMRPDAAVIVGCKRDGYVLNSETERLHQYWKGSALRWIPAGHFSALMSSRRALCDCVAEAAEKL
ncbi:MAG: alpha/beta hydrolase family protein [Acidobacteriota bacterium]|nr:alpha/beta hydrolase family protein [Acidobacteriota bacterium]